MRSLNINEKYEEIFSAAHFEGEIKFMEPMSKHTSLKIGGPADVFVIPHNLLSLKNLMVALKSEDVPFLTLGCGTNVLIKDGGIAGIVISLKSFKRIEVLSETKENINLHVGSGVYLQKLVSFSVENSYSGIEWLVGIPGSFGGAVFGNAGAFGNEIKDVLISVWIMNTEGVLNRVKAEDIHFEYRSSSISIQEFIIAGEIMLKKDKKEDVSARAETFLREKKERQPLSEFSAGCVFKNPPGTSAGKLIDEAGCKGMRIGDIEVSIKHANFFINRGKAKASDFLKLMKEVILRVHELFGVMLEPEIKIVGREC
jgi:UDP-N-acetylmuramate dehydrogenase